MARFPRISTYLNPDMAGFPRISTYPRPWLGQKPCFAEQQPPACPGFAIEITAFLGFNVTLLPKIVQPPFTTTSPISKVLFPGQLALFYKILQTLSYFLRFSATAADFLLQY